VQNGWTNLNASRYVVYDVFLLKELPLEGRATIALALKF